MDISRHLSVGSSNGTETVHDFHNFRTIGRQVAYARQLCVVPGRKRGTGEKEYQSDKDLWNDIIDRRVSETRRLFLTQFKVCQWIPQSPGLYYTKNAIETRDFIENASDYRELDDRSVFIPEAKLSMINSGIGCLNLDVKQIGDKKFKFLSASSSKNSHQGFVIAMDKDQYSKKIVPLIDDNGGAICNLVGELRHLDDSIPVKLPHEIPHLYLEVEDVEGQIEPINSGELNVTVSVSFEGEVQGSHGIFYTFSHFDPAIRQSLDDCVKWIRFNYVVGRYRGKVLTTFDELTPYFPNAVFPVEKMLDPNAPPKIIKDFIEKFRLKDDRVSTYYFINSLVGDVYSNINATDSVIGRSNIVNKANETFEFLDWIIGQDSSNEYAWFTKGLIYNYLQKYNEAIKCYDKSLAIYSDWIFISKVWNAKGIALQNLGKIEESKLAKNKAEEYRIGHETGHM